MPWNNRGSSYWDSCEGSWWLVRKLILIPGVTDLYITFPTFAFTSFVNRWRVCFWVSVVPAALLALCMEFCAESPHWLFKVTFYLIMLCLLHLGMLFLL